MQANHIKSVETEATLITSYIRQAIFIERCQIHCTNQSQNASTRSSR